MENNYIIRLEKKEDYRAERSKTLSENRSGMSTDRAAASIM